MRKEFTYLDFKKWYAYFLHVGLKSYAFVKHTSLFTKAVGFNPPCILFVLCCLPMAATAQNAGYGQVSAYEQLENNFCGSALAEDRLDVFGKRAEQKAADFIDYMRIIQDQTYDDEMRAYAAEAVKQLFDGDVRIITNMRYRSGEPADTTLYAFISAALDNNVRLSTQHNSFEMTQTFSSTSDMAGIYEVSTQYRGILRQPIPSSGYGYDSYNSKASKGQYIEIILKKVNKKFGKEEKAVWEVLLGNIWIAK